MRVLITGGTGSFGKAFVKKILSYNPDRIVVYSRDELKQSEMERELKHDNLRFFIGDVRDRDRLKLALRGIDTIVHAAALKRVEKGEYDPEEFVKTNVDGARNVMHAAIECGVRKVIALSTDKAVYPVNLYGCTKLTAEKIFVAANHLAGRAGPVFALVRYGNVVGSRGSVVPRFRELADRGSLDITDARMTRFLITLDQGVDLVLKAYKEMKGGEIFVPKIPSARIVDLANHIAPNASHRIVGIRPGEKLHEVLIAREESRYVKEFSDCYVLDYLDRWSGPGVEDDFEYSSASAELADLKELVA